MKNRTSSSAATSTDFHGASVIDASGREIPITEAMVEASFDQLIAQWDTARTQHASAPRAEDARRKS